MTRKSVRRQSRSYGRISLSKESVEERNRKFNALRDRLFLTKYENTLAKGKCEILKETNVELKERNIELEKENLRLKAELRRMKTLQRKEVESQSKRKLQMVKIVDFVNHKCESAAYTELYEKVIEPQTDMEFTEENFLKVQESILQFLLT